MLVAIKFNMNYDRHFHILLEPMVGGRKHGKRAHNSKQNETCLPREEFFVQHRYTRIDIGGNKWWILHYHGLDKHNSTNWILALSLYLFLFFSISPNWNISFSCVSISISLFFFLFACEMWNKLHLQNGCHATLLSEIVFIFYWIRFFFHLSGQPLSVCALFEYFIAIKAPR